MTSATTNLPELYTNVTEIWETTGDRVQLRVPLSVRQSLRRMLRPYALLQSTRSDYGDREYLEKSLAGRWQPSR